ncbi:MAG: glutamate-5-semialdehyde dehydrogenase [Planctomycetes bacterium]|nr:glutamate-5-semialdehyde dehydrogenase [Planctomycetota bacterium]
MTEIEQKAKAAWEASHVLATLSTETKNRVLLDLADSLGNHREAVLAANQKDMVAARASDLSSAKLNRLELTVGLLEQMSDGLRQIARLPDPIGAVVKSSTTESGLRVQKIRIPLGVIAMIYESRPNVTVDAFGLCFKAGNACFLKGGKEASHSNAALAELIKRVLGQHDIPTAAVEVMTTNDRNVMRELLTMDRYLDLVIPRGGTALIQFVHEHSRIPMVQHFHGVCHIYVDEFADLDKASRICVTAKTSAPATCNAAECMLIHESLADTFVPALCSQYAEAGVEVRGDSRVCNLAANAVAASDQDWGREYLDLVVAMKIVAGVDEAIAHIQTHGSNHTDAIISEDGDRQQAFIAGVGSSCVLTNASTRFNDGYQLGLGAEIGISTSRIHAYGPMGLEELTAQRYVVRGEGQSR